MASKCADNIVVLTKKDMQHNIDLYNTREKIIQIYNPIDISCSNDGYKSESKKIISCGRLTFQKGFDILVEVAEKVFAKHADWEWHIYGDGEDREKLENLIKDKRLEKNLILKGKSNNLLKLYNEYAMYVMTSRYEGFPLVNIEAHNARLPIVSFNCPCGPDELITDGVNGYLIECFDTDGMAEKICNLIEDEKLRIEMSNRTSLDKEKLQMGNIMMEWKKVLG